MLLYSPPLNDELIRVGNEKLFLISETDLKAIIAIKERLESDYRKEFPGIHALSKAVLMSESKFRKLFKKVYDFSPFDYYQRYRMLQAREFIIAGTYSISETGYLLGYQNLSNFSTSFKKEFSELPSEILRLTRA